jgi:UDP-2,3-diacylglucosamine pyrophosphatase LpxH
METTLVIGDLHLRTFASPAVVAALLELLRREPDAHLVFSGDSLDVAAEPCAPSAAIARILGRFPEVGHALAERAARGVRTTFVAGNHDAAVATAEGIEALREAIGVRGDDRTRIDATPWFVRLADGLVHVEHGHVFDPDGAPTHPLAPTPRDDVGIAILKGFIVPVGGHELVHVNAESPLRLLTRVIVKYGPRAPSVITRYIATALGTVRRAGKRFPLAEDRALARARLAEFAAREGLDPETLEALHAAHATPTMASATEAFLRLYLDRVFATIALCAGSGMASAGVVGLATPVGVPALVCGVPLATAGALALAASIVAKTNRYAGRADRALHAGADAIAEITGARTVVLGHVHVASEGPRYRNTASFAFTRGEGRPYLRVHADGEVARGFV